MAKILSFVWSCLRSPLFFHCMTSRDLQQCMFHLDCLLLWQVDEIFYGHENSSFYSLLRDFLFVVFYQGPSSAGIKLATWASPWNCQYFEIEYFFLLLKTVCFLHERKKIYKKPLFTMPKYRPDSIQATRVRAFVVSSSWPWKLCLSDIALFICNKLSKGQTVFSASKGSYPTSMLCCCHFLLDLRFRHFDGPWRWWKQRLYDAQGGLV